MLQKLELQKQELEITTATAEDRQLSWEVIRNLILILCSQIKIHKIRIRKSGSPSKIRNLYANKLLIFDCGSHLDPSKCPVIWGPQVKIHHGIHSRSWGLLTFVNGFNFCLDERLNP